MTPSIWGLRRQQIYASSGLGRENRTLHLDCQGTRRVECVLFLLAYYMYSGCVESLEKVVKVLRHRNHHRLANLLRDSVVEFDVSSTYGNHYFSLLTTADIYSPISEYDQLKVLSQDDNDKILDAMLEIWPPRSRDIEIAEIVYRLNPDLMDGTLDDVENLLDVLSSLRSTLIEVSTGGPRINTVNEGYKKNYSTLTQMLKQCGLTNPIPYSDLWLWYQKWRSGDLPTYQSRRDYLHGLFEPVENHLSQRRLSHEEQVFPEATGWPRVDRALGEIRNQLESAHTEEQFQAIGLLCRETLISLAETVFDPDQHPPIDEVIQVSKTDAKRMLDRYLSAKVSGRSNELSRKHAKASLDLANGLQHRRTATFQDAALCVEATASVVNIIAILSGIRGT